MLREHDNCFILGALIVASCTAWGCTLDFTDRASGTGGAGTSTQASTTGVSSNSAATGSSVAKSSANATGGGMSFSSAAGSSGASTGSAGVVPCGDQAGNCAISAGGCCWTASINKGMCSAPDGCSVGDTSIQCHLPSDCAAGKICCAGRRNNQSPYDVVACDAACELPSRVVCDPATPACPQGMTCQGSQLLPTQSFVCGF